MIGRSLIAIEIECLELRGFDSTHFGLAGGQPCFLIFLSAPTHPPPRKCQRLGRMRIGRIQCVKES